MKNKTKLYNCYQVHRLLQMNFVSIYTYWRKNLYWFNFNSCDDQCDVLELIEYQSDDVIKNIFQHFHDFFFHISIEYDEKPPHTKFGGNRFMVAQDMATWIPN